MSNEAYEFYIDGLDCTGGSDCGFVVEKTSGRVLRWCEYFMDADRSVIKIGETKTIPLTTHLLKETCEK